MLSEFLLLRIKQVKEDDEEYQYTYSLNNEFDDKSWIIGFSKEFLENGKNKEALYDYAFTNLIDGNIRIIKSLVERQLHKNIY